jgi:hypothetical protein
MVVCTAWVKATTAGNGVPAFRISGIWPPSKTEIPSSVYNEDRSAECEHHLASYTKYNDVHISNAQTNRPNNRNTEGCIKLYSKP